MAFRSIGTSSDDSSTTCTIPAPSGIVDGDILTVIVVSDNQGSTFTWPSGFVDITGSPITTTPADQRLACAQKVASSESGSYVVTSNDQCIGAVICHSGRNQSTTPHRSSTANQNTAQASPWSIATSAYGSNTSLACDIIVLVGSDTLVAGDVAHSAASSGLTQRADLVGTLNQFMNMAIYTLDGVSSGATGVYTTTGTQAAATSGWAAFSLALAAAASAVVDDTSDAQLGLRQPEGANVLASVGASDEVAASGSAMVDVDPYTPPFYVPDENVVTVWS